MTHRIEYAEPTHQRRPRVKETKHLDNIRQLPCVVCLRFGVEAAHLRTVCRKYGKRETGKGEKPSDRWTLPLCSEHHRRQHAVAELDFFNAHGIDPFGTALALWAADGDIQLMTQIVQEARR